MRLRQGTLQKRQFTIQIHIIIIENNLRDLVCMAKKNIALIGLGPHAKRIYLNYFRKHRVNFALLVDLDSKKNEISNYLKDNDFSKTNIYTINDDYKDNDVLPKYVEKELLSVFEKLNITHMIISTEPKAHFMYLQFALKHNINVISDKPITVNKNMTSLKSIKKTRKQFYQLLKLYDKSSANCKIMCQRQYHRGYEYIKKILTEVVTKYQIPITYIDIYHSDGNWEMPHDLNKENHPYKYGYGKLFHSGYHFIDLLSSFLKINDNLPASKRIKYGEVYTTCFTPEDELSVFNFDDYKRIFKDQNIPDYYNKKKCPSFHKYGEKNCYNLFSFKNHEQKTITNANLNLLHYAFSRRGWIQSRDYYKKNGRIRHERVNIQVGPLLNIQIHSYQSKEIKDRSSDMLLEQQVGGLEHFDIFIYRNSDIIGGKTFEKVQLGDLYTAKEKQNILGYNELSREEFLNNFLHGKNSKGDLKEQQLAIEILYDCAKGIRNYYKKHKKVERIKIQNSKSIIDIIAELKKYAFDSKKYSNTFRYKKAALKSYSTVSNNLNELLLPENMQKHSKKSFEFGTVLNKLITKNKYEVYLYVCCDNNIASGLFYKQLNSKFFANMYYQCLKVLAKFQRVSLIKNLLKI